MKDFFFRKHSRVSIGTLNLEGPWAPHIFFMDTRRCPHAGEKFVNMCFFPTWEHLKLKFHGPSLAMTWGWVRSS